MKDRLLTVLAADGKDRVDASRRDEWKNTMNEAPQHQILGFIESCRLDGENPATWLVGKQIPLVAAVDKGHFQVLRQLLDLLDQLTPESPDQHANYKEEALKMALLKKYDHSAALLVNSLNTSEPQRFGECFIASDKDARIPLSDYFKDSYQNFWLALLDAMWDQKDLNLFEQNSEGRTITGSDESNFHKLADWGNTTVFNHATVRLCIKKKWEECGRKKQFICDMLIYLFTLAFLTVVVALSGQAEDVNSYKTGEDYARLVFEILSGALLLYSLIKEAYELIRAWQQEVIRGQNASEGHFIHVWRGMCFYWKDHFNKAECISSLLLLPVSIIVRFAYTNAYWYIFAIGYFVWVLIIFKYSSINRELSTYAQSLWIIITTDVVFFLVLFAVVNLALSGFFFLILKGDGTLHVHNETSTFLGTLFVGVRALTDGQNSLSYYDADGGTEGFNKFMSVATMVVFLFVVVVILANILIAQLSTTYNNVQEDARGAALVRKACSIARLERSAWPYCCGPEQNGSEDFTNYDKFEKNITTKIDNNVESLVKKLPVVETSVVGLKAEAMRCRKEWAETETEVKKELNELMTNKGFRDVNILYEINRISDTLDEMKDNIEKGYKDVAEKIGQLK